jgi:FixJ family two-component response regulator
MSGKTPATVAVVDDDARLRQSLGRLLEASGYAVCLFSSGASLLEYAEISGLSCLVTDLAMPQMDGFELQEVVRKLAPGLPVILITGRDEPNDVTLAQASSSHAFFRKPFDVQAFLNSVAAAVEQRSI